MNFKLKKFSVIIYTVVVLVLLLFIVLYVAPAFAGKLPVRNSFSLGSLVVHYYSLAILAGIFASYWVAGRYAKHFGLNSEHLENLFIIAVLCGLVGARLHHVFSDWAYYSENFSGIFKIWKGGLGFYGGVIGAVAGVGIYSRIKKINFLGVADFLAFVLPLGHAFGRWGNFFNQEAYGYPTLLPWKMFISLENRLSGFLGESFFHPVFLYESLWDIIIFGSLFLVIKNRRVKADGLIFSLYLILYSMGRFFIEGLRADATWFFGVRLNQLLALLFMTAGLAVFCLARHRPNSGLANLVKN